MRMGFSYLYRRGRILACCAILLSATFASAEACVTQSEMPPATRDMLAARARQLAQLSLTGNINALRAASTADLSRSFTGVEEAVAQIKDQKSASVTISAMYLFEATQHQTDAMQGATQFYCGAYSTPAHVTLTLSNLPPGRYALVITEATGVPDPRFLSFVLQDVTAPAPATADSWKLGGFISRPMTIAGHDAIYFWRKARQAVKDHELWNASVQFELARQLVMPVLFLSSANSEKLADEQQVALPVDWPTPAKPLTLQAGPHKVDVASVSPSFSGTEEWLVIDTVASARPATAPTADGTQVTTAAPIPQAPPPGMSAGANAVAAALIARIPEFKAAFQGIYVHAQSDNVTAAVPMKSL